MKENELRIGNYYNQYGYYTKVSWFTLKELEDAPTSQLWCKPIPLTEDILLKCGFVKVNRIDFGELKPCYAIFSLAVMIRHNSFFIDWIGGNTEIKYLDQLQNLYFSFTNKELEINL